MIRTVVPLFRYLFNLDRVLGISKQILFNPVGLIVLALISSLEDYFLFINSYLMDSCNGDFYSLFFSIEPEYKILTF